jgi:hypothetical protein
MTNILQVNTGCFLDFTHHLNILWSAPMQIIICVLMLYSYLGVASFFGILTMILFVPFNIFATNKSKKVQKDKLKLQDTRIKMMNEILTGMKVNKNIYEFVSNVLIFRLLNFTYGKYHFEESSIRFELMKLKSCVIFHL